MKFRIAKPEIHIDTFKDGSMYYEDVSRLYDVLPAMLDDMDIKYDLLHITKGGRRMYLEDNSIYLAWHNHGTLPNIWHLNISCLPNYFYFDKTGYGPWSEIVDECDYKMPVEVVRKDIEKFCESYRSRIPSPDAAFIPDTPYVLVLGQRPDDAVSQFAHIKTEHLPEKVYEAYKGTDITVATRQHPLMASQSYGTVDTFQTTGNLQTVIDNALAIYTVNSGSGFEAVLRNKRVFTTGRSDYHWVTTEIHNGKELAESVDMIDEPLDEDNRIQFLHYYLNYHLMNIDNPDSIRYKILRSAMEYEN